MLLELVQKGQDSHQGVGYLTDGTMVVVEHANKNIGQTIEIEFIRSLQTAAGKMMFAKPVERPQQVAKVQKPTGKRPVTQSKPAASEPVERQQSIKTSYHSDAKERRYEKKDTQKPQQPRVNDRPRQVRNNKPRTSVQREAALIDLVEKQE
jgi:hypothetical protein